MPTSPLSTLQQKLLNPGYPRLPGKTVYLLGAGFSASMGIPVMKGFLSAGLKLLKPAPNAWNSEIEKVLELMARFQSLFMANGRDEPSLEELFCVVDLFGSKEDRLVLCGFVRAVFEAAWINHETKLGKR